MVEGKEVDEDLTMIQPEPTATEAAYDDLIENASARSAPEAVTGPITNAGKTTGYIESLQESQMVDQSFKPGEIDPDLDGNRSMFEDQNSVRSRNQNEAIKGIKAVGGGILQGGLIALEQAGYVADIDTYTNLFAKAGDYSGNWWTRMMKSAQDGLRDSEAFKIYEESENPNSLSSKIFKWSSLEGAISSAVGFGVTGLGAAKLVSYLGSMGKFQQLAKFTDITMGNIAGAEMAGATAAFTGPLASSAMSNFFMGQMMATDTYNQAMEQLKPMIDSGEITARKAQELSALEAEDVVALNMALTATAYIKFGSIFKRKGRINSLVENPTALNQMKNLIKTGSPTAFTENVYQEMIQMEQLYDVNKAVGRETEESDNYWDRMTQLALSDRAMHAGALGVVGGPIQFAIIQRPFMKEQIAEQKKAYQEQQALVNKKTGWNKALTENNFNVFRKFETSFNEAVTKGELRDAEFVDDVHMLTQLSKNVEWGTTSIIKKDMEDIVKMTPEEAVEAGFGEDYKEVAQSVIDIVVKTQFYTKTYAGAPNKGAIVHNRLLSDRATQEIQSLEKSNVETIKNLVEILKTKFDNDVSLNAKGKFALVREETRFDNITEAKKAVLRATESTQDQAFDDFLKHSHEFKDLQKGLKSLKKYEKFYKDLFNKHEELINPKNQNDYVEQQEQATRNAKRNVEKVDEVKEEEKADSSFTSFAEVVNKAPQFTEEELVEKRKEWDEESSIRKNFITDTTFSGVDNNGVVRQYTPGDLVRSNDGRYFTVTGQSEASTKKGTVKMNMPVLRESDEKGSSKGEDVKQFILQDNTFLRDEARQAYVKRDGSRGQGFEKVWGTYVKTDSLLKPNDFKYQKSLLDLADNGEVISINISANRLKSGDFKWLDDYQHHLLNLPYSGEYDVVYKLNKVGPKESYVDVYKRVEGQPDVKLTRLNREANLNHQALLDMLTANKGEITGKAIGHYSNRFNLVKQMDAEGNPVFSPISDLKGLNPAYKINGKIIIAQTKGDGPNVFPKTNVARDQDGTIYADEYINVKQPDGSIRALSIPYSSMGVGDSYALILSPSGEIIPIALSADKLSDIPSAIGGENFTADVIQSWQEAIDTWLSEELQREEEIDKDIENQLAVAQNTREDKLPEVFADKKESIIYKKDRTNRMYDVFSTTVNTHIRDNYRKYSILGSAKDGKPIYDKNKKGQRIVRANYFHPTIAVSVSTRKFVPAIEVQHPTVKTSVKKYNLIDHPQEFYELLGRQRKRTPISTLADTSIDGKAEMKALINSNGLKIDVDTTNPFIGSSGTFTVDGNDFKEKSAEAANTKRSYLKNKFKKQFKDVAPILEDKTQETLEEFNLDIDSILNQDNDWLIDVNDANDEFEIKGLFDDKISSLGVRQQRPASVLLAEIFDSVPESQEAEFNDIIEKLKDRGMSDNTEAIAKGILGLRRVQDEVNSGGMDLSDKQRLKSEEDPSGRHTQPEGLKFERGTQVYHSEFGKATFKTNVKDNMFKLVLNNKKEVVVYPGDTFIHDGIRAQLAQVNKDILKAEDGSTRLTSLLNKKIRLEGKIARELKGKESTSASSPSDNKLINVFEAMDVKPSLIDTVKTFDDTGRTQELATAIQGLQDIIGSFTGNSQAISEALTIEVSDRLKASIPYTQANLDELIDLAEENVRREINTVENRKAAVHFRNLGVILKALDRADTSKATTVKGERYIKSKDKFTTAFFYLPGTFNDKGTALSTADMQANLLTISTLLQNAVLDEARLKASYFINENSPKPVDNTVKDKPVQELDEIFGPQETISTFERKTVKEGINPLDVTSNKGKLVNVYKAPTEVMSIVEDGTASPVAIKSLVEQAEDLYASEIPLNELFKDFVEAHAKFRIGTEVGNTDFDAEVAQVKAMLPQVPIEVVENVTSMVNRFGVEAIGAYHKGVQYLVKEARKGTAYHEAFHAVADLYLTKNEKSQIARERGKESWSLALEEELADDFAKHIDTRTYKRGNLVQRFFRSIMGWFRGVRSVDITTKIFDKIVTKGYANSRSLKWENNVSPIFNSIQEYKTSLSRKNSVLLQSLLDNNKLEIVC